MEASYRILKYSRPSEDASRLIAQFEPTSVDSQWQHFANPTLHVLSGGLAPDRPVNYVRVRIVWHPASRTESHPPPQGHVLEDIDLLSFPPASSLPMTSLKSQNQGLPLKAVYRDSVVGFRYLHPCIIPTGYPPSYRRFQISFPDPSSAKEFIQRICHVCPCKASPPPAAEITRGLPGASTAATFQTPAKRAKTINVSSTSFPIPVQPASSQSFLPINRSLVNNTRSQLANTQPPFADSSWQVPPVTPKRTHTIYHNPLTLPSFNNGIQMPLFDPVAVSSSGVSNSRFPQTTVYESTSVLSSPTTAHTLGNDYRRDDQPLNQSRAISPHRPSPTTSAPSRDLGRPASASQNLEECGVAFVARIEKSTNVDTSRTPSMSNPSVSSRELHNRHSDDELTSSSHPSSVSLTKDLRAVKELYNMPVDQLERLVGEVIREPGFLSMLERLDNMWKVKGFISRE